MSGSPRSRRFRSAAAVLLVMGLVVGGTALPSSALTNTPHDVVVSADPANWTPHVLDGRINAILPVGNRIIAAGSFSQIQAATGGPAIAKDNIFAFNATTGAIDPNFTASVTGGEISALELGPDGNVFVGGNFVTVNGVTSRRLAKLNATTGARITAFASLPSAAVIDLEVSGTTLYVAGRFTTIKSQPRELLAAVNTTNGNVDPNLDLPVTESRKQGVTAFVNNIGLSPDGTKLVLTGNFTRIAGLTRWQVGMIDLSTSPATVSSWDTTRFTPACAINAFDTYMRDVDWAPDGSYFAIVTTGAFSGGLGSGTLCDTLSRWEGDATGPNQQPTWTSYTGGDTLYSVAITTTAIYTGGHQRWMNNPFAGDAQGPGAVPREGISAHDPANGVPFSWNPGRARGVGVFALVATEAGLWLGSDTDRVAGELHRKLAFFPVNGGTTVPSPEPADLPADLYNVNANRCPEADDSILYRVNAGGPQVPAVDCGPGWMADDATNAPGSAFHTTGSSTSAFDQNYTVAYAPAGPVPITAPKAIYASERWDASGGNPMQWNFPVQAGRAVQVRLYLANQFAGTSQPGQRVFNISVDGSVLSGVDMAAQAGHRVGSVRTVDIVADGNVDIDFSHVVENPLVNAIEIVTDDQPGPFPSCAGVDPSILHRVNAAGAEITAIDCGPAWLADDTTNAPGAVFHTTGSNVSASNNPFAVTGAVPSSTPGAIFLTERWDPSGGNPMQWNFTVPSGTPIEVRLYFINQCTCTGPGGTPRIFDVQLDGTTVLNDYNIVTDVGDRTGTMRAFQVTSDGNVDVDFSHVSENPLINAIEIVRTDVPSLQAVPQDSLTRRHFDGSSLGPIQEISTPNVNWANVRGAFALGGILYMGWNDGRVTARGFTGNILLPEQNVNLYGLTNFPVSSLTGMFYANGGIYYTVENNSNLFFRFFTPESRILGAQVFTISGSGDGLNWGQTRGLTMADGKLYFARSNGNLYSMDFGDASVQGGSAPVPGTEIVVSPANAGYDWSSRALFAFEPVPLDLDPPTVPSKPTGLSPSIGTVTVSWGASTDVTPPIVYRVFRDEQPVPIAEVTGTSFVDEQLAPGSTHRYAIQAMDGLGNLSALGPLSDPILVDTAYFSDTFATGDLSLWSASTGLTIDPAQGSPDAPSVRGTPSGQAANAHKDLDDTYETACLSAKVNVASGGGNAVDLLRLRSSENGAIVKAFINANGILIARSDFAGVQQTSGVALGSGWHEIELCGTVGESSTWDLYRDGVAILSGWSTNAGTDPIARVQIGDTANKTWTANFDQVRLDDAPGAPEAPDFISPTTPGTPVGQSVVPGSIELSWAPSTDASTPITYRVYRDGGSTPVGQTTNTSFTDTGLEPGSTHTYTVEAVDAADNVSSMSGTSDEITVLVPDETPPSTPGTPSGQSFSEDSITISWAPSTDPSTPITYRVYRDGGSTPVGQTTQTSFTDTGLEPGSTHTYTVEAVDAADNVSSMSGTSDEITVLAPDTTPPTTPGTPSGQSLAPGSIALSWAASTDPSTPITYRIYRDGGSTPVGQTTQTSFTDTGLAPGSSHTYRVDAVDSANNPSPMSSASASITVMAAPSAIFADDFSAGNLATWSSVTRITIDGGQGSPSAPSARGNPSNLSAFAYRDLGAPVGNACFSVNVNMASQNGAVDLFRLRTAAGGAVMKAFVNPSGILALRSDLAGAQQLSGVALGSGWHNVELCGTVGTSSTWTLYRDGTQILNWSANSGTDPIGRVQIGDTANKTWTANFDQVRLDQEPGDGGGGDTTPPTTPGTPSGQSLAPGSIALSWAASTDPSTPITYRIYRDGGSTPVGQTTQTSFTDTGLAPGSSHTYRVDAVDSANNPSPMSSASASITVMAAPSAIFADDFSAGNLATWSSVTRITIDGGQGSPSAPSARGNPSNLSAFAYRDLGAPVGNACFSVNVNMASQNGAVDLFRLRTAAGGAVMKAFVNPSGILALRSDLAGAQQLSGVALGSGWHNVELCGTVGTSSTWTLYRDGTQILNWSANSGTDPIGRVQIGDTANKTWTANFDQVRLDQAPGDA